MAKTNELLDYYIEAMALQVENKFLQDIHVSLIVNQLIELDKISLIDEDLVDINNRISMCESALSAIAEKYAGYNKLI